MRIEPGQVVAERSFALFRRDGSECRVRVRLGVPCREANGDYRCALQVLGIGDDRVRTAWGEDAFVALQYAIEMAGQVLDGAVAEQQLEIRFRGAAAARSWIWRYPPG